MAKKENKKKEIKIIIGWNVTILQVYNSKIQINF